MNKVNYLLAVSARVDRINAPSPEEVKQAIATFDARPELHFVRDIVRVIANTGLKNRELIALRPADVDSKSNNVIVSRMQSGRFEPRILPVGPLTAAALLSLHARNEKSDFLLGEFPGRRVVTAVQSLQSLCPYLARGRNVLQAVRFSYICQLLRAGIPLGLVNYYCGRRGTWRYARGLQIPDDQRLEIMRRNIKAFIPEL